MPTRIIAVVCCALIATTLMAAEKFEAEKATLLGKAVLFADARASGGMAVKRLGAPGSGLRFDRVPAAKKLAIRYASKTDMGTYSIRVNDQPPVRVNFHSTGGWDTYYTDAVIGVSIPAGATLRLLAEPGDGEWSVDYILLGKDDLGLKPDIWNLPRFVPARGHFTPDWKSLAEHQTPEWFREAKFGIWNHFTPEVVAEQGDWYYVGMYNSPDGAKWQHDDFIKRFGHPSEKGFIDFLDLWKCKAWDPARLMKLCAKAGAKYFVELANHHDNFDNWNSKYQPFNSVNFGPRRDLVGVMAQEARKNGLRFGVSYHATPTATWRLFMPASYGCDATGDKAGKPYDGKWLTIADGAGRFWNGFDPRDFYGPVHAGTVHGAFVNGEPQNPNEEMFFRQFFWRQDDLLKYRPDLLYFDTGLCHDGFGMPEAAKLIAANYYNKAMSWNKGTCDAVLNLKYPDGQEKALVIDYEASSAAKIQAYPWQTDISIAGWSYYTGQELHHATWVIKTLASNVARNGNLLLNLTLRADGSLDAPIVAVCEGVSAWMQVNGETIYGSRPFECDHEGETFFTRRNGFIYATIFAWPKDGKLVLASLRRGGGTVGKVIHVELLGQGALPFTQDEQAMVVESPREPAAVGGVEAFVLRVTQDKQWVNDDDPGIKYVGWNHECNLGGGEFNNDVHSSRMPGAVCEYAFTGRGVQLIGTKDAGWGSLEVSVDGTRPQSVSLATPSRQTQAVLLTRVGLVPGPHVIKIVNKAEAMAAIDAFDVRP